MRLAEDLDGDVTSILYPLFPILGGKWWGKSHYQIKTYSRFLTDAVKMLVFLIVREAVARGLALVRRFIGAG